MTEKQIKTKQTDYLNWQNKKFTDIRDNINALIEQYGEDITLSIIYDGYENAVYLMGRYKERDYLKEDRRREYEKLKENLKMNNISYKEKVKMTAQEFKYLVGLLPHDIYWGDPLTPQLLKEILDNFKLEN